MAGPIVTDKSQNAKLEQIIAGMRRSSTHVVRGRVEPVKPHGSTPGRNWLRKQAKKRAK
jgi:hypothetical protein